jgi:pyrroline-5-carboxylate reductase
VLVGGGKMGGAMLEGWLKRGLSAASIVVLDPKPSDWLVDLRRRYGFALNPDPAGLGDAGVLVLAIKPQMLDAAAPVLAGLAGPETVVLSILAGKTLGDLAQRLPRARRLFRAMPNTPAAVGRGISGVAASPEATPADWQKVNDLLEAIGRIIRLDSEALIDAVTAVSGSGPAYVFHMVECLAEAGRAAGLPEDVAMTLARATIEGAGELLYREPATTPAQLRINVTSPGGTTAAALEVLMAADGLAPLMTRAVAAARRRAGELSG